MSNPAAQDARHIWQELLHLLPSGVILFDAQGRVQETNPAARTALGYDSSQDAPQGLTLHQLFRRAELYAADGTPLGRAAAMLRDAARSQQTLQRQSMRYTTPEGEGRRLGLTLFPLRHRDPERKAAPGSVCLLTDLTAIQAMEEELQRRRSLSALGEMAAGIAHEFKNGLATIYGYGQMLRSSLDGPARDQVEHLLTQATMLNEIATEFLTFARPLTVQSEPVALGPLLDRCIAGLRVQDFPHVRIEVQGEFPSIAGDPSLLASAFTNLLRNACESIGGGTGVGAISVRARGSHDGHAALLFEDDGPGMPPAIADKIFIPFFTTKPRGTGLGLPMVHKIVTAHRGSILLADAAPGHTVFEVRLPLAAVLAQESAAGGRA